MSAPASLPDRFNILAIGQAGRLQYEALLLAASLRLCDPGFSGTLFIAEPQPGPLWPTDPRMEPEIRALLASLGAEILPFENRVFGASYPHGNKIEALCALPEAPFLFLDSDTLITGPLSQLAFDFAHPSASMRRENTWPEPQLYRGDLNDIWGALYARFGLELATSLDLSWPENHWQRYLYFNAGWFFHQSPQAFGARFLDYARQIRDDPGDALACQSLDPWLDQVALPLVIHALGGGRPGPELDGLDGDLTCHWRVMALLYARESDHVVDVLERVMAMAEIGPALAAYPPFRKMICSGEGARVRALFRRDALPRKERVIRNTIRRAGLWSR